jgi:N-acetylglucosaminyldiphosphoundecaprenol N-acetyl-beta-D-mannosaminyltransferase
MRKLLIILGVPIDDLSMPETLDRIEEFVAHGRATGRTHQIATINADFVVNALHDPELGQILQESDLATPDGMPLVKGARLLGVPLEGRVTGADLVPALAERAAQKGYTLFLLGAREGVAVQAAEVLRRRYPGLQVAGTLSPPNRPLIEMDHSIVDVVKAARPDILLVAFGNPKQEKWINMHAAELTVPVCIGVGGTLDLIAGVTRRAPAWMQNAGLEWLFRLSQEPRRLWKRYVVDLCYFGFFFVRQWWVMRQEGPPAPLLPAADVLVIDGAAVISVRGRLDVGNQAGFIAQAEEALAVTPVLAVNLAAATFLDSSALGTLVALANRARALGGDLQLLAVPPQIVGVLELLRLDHFFKIAPDLGSALRLDYASPKPSAAAAASQDGWAVVRMPRMLDATTVSVMVDQCEQQLARNPQLILDFSETVFLSSAGLSVMARLQHRAQEHGGELRVAGCSRDVLHSIQLVRLDAVVPLFQDVPAAASQAPAA